MHFTLFSLLSFLKEKQPRTQFCNEIKTQVFTHSEVDKEGSATTPAVQSHRFLNELTLNFQGTKKLCQVFRNSSECFIDVSKFKTLHNLNLTSTNREKRNEFSSL